MANDAVSKEPSLDDQMSQFKGFSTVEGDIKNDGKPTGTAAKAPAAASAKGAKAAPVAKQPPAELEEGDDETNDDERGNGDEENGGEEGGEGAAAPAAKQADDAKKRSAKEQINKAVKAQRAAERERDEWRGRVAALEARVNSGLTAPAAAATTTTADGAPDPSKFEYGELDGKYIRALARWEAKQELAEHTKTQQTANQSAAQQRETAQVAEKMAAFEDAGVAKFDDFAEVVIDGAKDGDWPLSDVLGRLIVESDVGPDIAYHLATHPDEARKIFGKSAMHQAAAFGRLEAQFSSPADANSEDDDAEAEPAKAAKLNGKVPKAPAPPAKQARGQGSRTGAPDASTDFRAFEAAAMRKPN